MKLKLWPVYDGGIHNHHPSERLFRILRHMPEGTVISDRMAQTIAAWWHSPASPYSTVLSTMGQVDRYMSLSDFGNPDDAETEDDKAALLALGAYIAAKQAAAESGARPCACRDCMSIAVGTPGELCSECAEWGCDPTDESAGCDVPGAYGDDDDPCPDHCGECLYCIPGA